MGVWSSPLFTTHPDLKVDLGWFRPQNKCGILVNCLTKFTNEDFETGRVVKLAEFMSAICDTAKIYGYLDTQNLEKWQDFMTRVADFNPGTKSFELHFFCEDDQTPFCFTYHEDGCAMETFQAYHCAFFDWKRQGPVFDKNKYIKRYSKVSLRDYRTFDSMINNLSQTPFVNKLW